MKYIFYSTTAIPCETDLAKAKEKLSFLGKPKEYNCFHHDFKGFKIENIFNDNLFVEEINETIHFKCDVIILQFAFIYTQFQFEVSDSSSFGEILLNDEKGNNFYFKPREELKKIKIESLHDIQTKLLLFNFYNIESFQDNFKKFDVTLSLHQQAPIIKDAIKKHTLAIPSMFSTTISTSTGEIYIESNSREQTNLIINHKKLKVWKNNKQDDGSYFFNGDLEKLEEALIHYRITISLLYGHMYLLGAVLTDAAKASEDIQKKITNKNPIFWDNLSLDIEYVQLEFVNIQRIISGQLVRLQNSTVLKNLYVEKHYEDFNNNIQQKIKHIFSLAKEVNSALINMSTPIKAKNDFRLQESTDRVNDKILFLSFIAMSIPLITSITSQQIALNTKIISGTIIFTLPFIYYFINSIYKKRLIRKNKINTLKEALDENIKNTEATRKRITEIKKYDEAKQNLLSVELTIRKSNLEMHEARQKKLKQKIKEL